MLTPPYVTAEPEVFQLSRKELGDFFIVMATDGLYDMMDDDDVVSLVGGYIESKAVYLFIDQVSNKTGQFNIG